MGVATRTELNILSVLWPIEARYQTKYPIEAGNSSTKKKLILAVI